jgi:hypothetical protein
VRHAFIAARLLWQAQAGTSNHRLRHVLVGV